MLCGDGKVKKSKNRTVLIVDDERDLAEAARYVLESEGYTVFIASSAERAIERLNVLTPSVILLDINMPGMNGFEFCRLIRTRYNALK